MSDRSVMKWFDMNYKSSLRIVIQFGSAANQRFFSFLSGDNPLVFIIKLAVMSNANGLNRSFPRGSKQRAGTGIETS